MSRFTETNHEGTWTSLAMSTQCPICADTMSHGMVWISSRHARNSARELPCCHQKLCQTCLFHHVQSILEEGMTGQGRQSIKCPFGCGEKLGDAGVRDVLKSQHSQYALWTLVGLGTTAVQYVMLSFFWLCGLEYDTPSLCRENWLFWTLSREARQQLDRYELWSLTCGFRQLGSIQHCPMPDCGYAWVTSPTHKHSKQAHENKTYRLWYSPPRQEKIPYDWVEPEYLTMQGDYIEESTAECRDGRRMVCAKCHALFCGLCNRPWTIGRKAHVGVSCRRYNRLVPDPEYTIVGEAAGCRTCPGCSLRTSRIDGCNHMICPCGTEWCYVCECRWRVTHYGCTENRRRAHRRAHNMQQVDQCAIL